MAKSSEVYLERINSTIGNTKLKITVTKVEEDIENKFIRIEIPVIGSKQDSNAPKTRYKDLKRLRHIFTVEGYIFAQQNQSADGKYYDSDIVVKGDSYDVDTQTGTATYLTATQAKNALIYYILYPSGDLNFYWRGLAKDDSTPGTDLASLMEDDLTDATRRKTKVIFDKLKFIDAPGLRKDIEYFISSGFKFDEFNAEKYNFIMTLTKGELL